MSELDVQGSRRQLSGWSNPSGRCALTSPPGTRRGLARRRTRRRRPARPDYHRASCTSCTRLPQVSFSMAIVDPVTAVGGIVNSAPRALIRS